MTILPCSARTVDLSSRCFDAARMGIEGQQALVATLVPGSRPHRTATGVLLLLRDSLFVMTETRVMLEQTRRRSDPRAPHVAPSTRSRDA